MNKKKILLALQIIVNLILFIVLINTNSSFAYSYPNETIVIPTSPGGSSKPILMYNIADYIIKIADFFIIIGPVLLIISLVLSAITYMAAGANPGLAAKAKKWFGFSLIGGLVIMGVGVIINTVAAIVSREFFCKSILGFGCF